MLDRLSVGYPRQLLDLKDPPDKLYLRGDYRLDLFAKSLAIVGSRKMSDYGRKVISFLLPKLVSAGVTIISGFMYGVDAFAHAECLRLGGKTVAVMPCGVDIICPESQVDLHARLLASGGLVVSEYANGVPPRPWTFPRRNRLISALAQAVLVVEAEEKSGALITAEVSRKLGRAVFFVPGSIFASNMRGNWKLLYSGAFPVTSPRVLLNFFAGFGLTASTQPSLFNTGTLGASLSFKDMSFLSKDERLVLSSIRATPLTLDQVALATGFPISRVLSLVTLLSLKGYISRSGRLCYYG